jgi:hypothetical protein
MAQNRLITDLVSLVIPSNNDALVIVDNTTNPSLAETKQITYANLKENLQDMIDILVASDATITSTYSDVGNSITLSVNNNTSTQKIIVSNGGTTTGTRQQLNVMPGAGITIASADSADDDRVNLSFATTAVSTASGLAGVGTTISTLGGVTSLADSTQSINLRALKAGSSKISLALTDSNESIAIDIDSSQININDVSSATPLGTARGGTGASAVGQARTNLGAASAGVNNDITSLTGMTTALSVGQGGTDAGNAADALFNLNGMRVIENAGAVGQSLVVNGAQNVSGEYRGQLKSIRPASNKTSVATVNNEITIDVDPDNILAEASQNLNFNGFRITNVALPLADTDVATKAYSDSVAQGLTVKEAVRAASLINFPSTYFDSIELITAVTTATNNLFSEAHVFNTGDRVRISSDGSVPGGLVAGRIYFVIDVDADNIQLANTVADANGGTEINITSVGSGVITVTHALYLQAPGNGALTMDGVNVVANDRVILQDQTDATQNGIYVVADPGTVSAPAILVRADDFNASAEVISGSFAFVNEGTDNGDVAFVQITQDPILDVSNLVFTPFSTNNVPDNSVTNAKLADMTVATIKGRPNGVATGDPIDLSADQVVAIINTMTSAVSIDCGEF